MHSEDLVVNDCRNWQTIKAICKGFPDLDVIPSFTLVIETIDAVDRGSFMIATQDEKILRIFDLVGQKKAYGLERVFPSVDIVS